MSKKKSIFSGIDIKGAGIKLIMALLAPIILKYANEYYNWVSIFDVSLVVVLVTSLFLIVLLLLVNNIQNSNSGIILLNIEYVVILSFMYSVYIISYINNQFNYIDEPTVLIFFNDDINKNDINLIQQKIPDSIRFKDIKYKIEVNLKGSDLSESVIDNIVYKNPLIKSIIYISKNDEGYIVKSKVPIVSKYFGLKIYEIITNSYSSNYYEFISRKIKKGYISLDLYLVINFKPYEYRTSGGSVTTGYSFSDILSSIKNREKQLKKYSYIRNNVKINDLWRDLNSAMYFSVGTYLDFIGMEDKSCGYIIEGVESLGIDVNNYKGLHGNEIENIVNCFFDVSNYYQLVEMYKTADYNIKEMIKSKIDDRIVGSSVESANEIISKIKYLEDDFGDTSVFVSAINKCGRLKYIYGVMPVDEYKKSIRCYLVEFKLNAQIHEKNSVLINKLIEEMNKYDVLYYVDYKDNEYVKNVGVALENFGGDWSMYCKVYYGVLLLNQINSRLIYKQGGLNLNYETGDGAHKVKKTLIEISDYLNAAYDSVGCVLDDRGVFGDYMDFLIKDFMWDFINKIKKHHTDGENAVDELFILNIEEKLKEFRGFSNYDLNYLLVTDSIREGDFVGAFTYIITSFLDDFIPDEEHKKELSKIMSRLLLMYLHGAFGLEFGKYNEFDEDILVDLIKLILDDMSDPALKLMLYKMKESLLDSDGNIFYSKLYPNFYMGYLNDLNDLLFKNDWVGLKKLSQTGMMKFDSDVIIYHYLAISNEMLGELDAAVKIYRKLSQQANSDMRKEFYNFKANSLSHISSKNKIDCIRINNYVIDNATFSSLRNRYNDENYKNTKIPEIIFILGSLINILDNGSDFENTKGSDILGENFNASYRNFSSPDSMFKFKNDEKILSYLSASYLDYKYSEIDVDDLISYSNKDKNISDLLFDDAYDFKNSDISLNKSCFSLDEQHFIYKVYGLEM